jgi:hypothetical protein
MRMTAPSGTREGSEIRFASRIISRGTRYSLATRYRVSPLLITCVTSSPLDRGAPRESRMIRIAAGRHISPIRP